MTASKRADLKLKLDRSFEYYANPGKDDILCMRRAFLLHRRSPASTLSHWMDKNASKTPLYMLPRARNTFNRLEAERDAIHLTSASSDMHRWTRNSLWNAMNVVAVQAVDPWWNGTRLEDIRLPNLMDWAYLSNPATEFYGACWMDRSNMSFLIATADDARVPDYSAASHTVMETPCSELTPGILDRIRAGVNLHRAVRDTLDELGYDEDSQVFEDVMTDMASVGLYVAATDIGSQRIPAQRMPAPTMR